MNLSKLTDLMAGHIARPYTEEEILTILDDGEYSAELMLQHVLLLWKRTSSQRDQLLEAIANALHDPSISAKSKRPLADAFSSVREGKP